LTIAAAHTGGAFFVFPQKFSQKVCFFEI